MSGFAPGDEVVCIFEQFEHLNPGWGLVPAVVLHAHYVVHSIGEFGGREYLRLHELHPEYAEYESRAFRPVRREAIEIFRAMCTSAKPLVDIGFKPAVAPNSGGNGSADLVTPQASCAPNSFRLPVTTAAAHPHPVCAEPLRPVSPFLLWAVSLSGVA